MTGGGWVRTITATDYAWAGNDNTDADPETLVAFRGSSSDTRFLCLLVLGSIHCNK